MMEKAIEFHVKQGEELNTGCSLENFKRFDTEVQFYHDIKVSDFSFNC